MAPITMNRTGGNKCQAMKKQLQSLEKSLENITFTLDRVDRRAQVLDKKLHDGTKLLRRDSYVLHLMELFIRHPGLASSLAQHVSIFFQRLLRHVEKECPSEAPLLCVRQIWSRERKNKAVKLSRMRFCQSYSMSSTMISALNEIHNCFCDSGLYPLTQISSSPKDMNTDEILTIIENELPENVVAAALKHAIVATQNPPAGEEKKPTGDKINNGSSVKRCAKSMSDLAKK